MNILCHYYMYYRSQISREIFKNGQVFKQKENGTTVRTEVLAV